MIFQIWIKCFCHPNNNAEKWTSVRFPSLPLMLCDSWFKQFVNESTFYKEIDIRDSNGNFIIAVLRDGKVIEAIP